MRDEVKLAAPLGLLGIIAEKAGLELHMRTLLQKRNVAIKQAAENTEWQKFL
jgi:hypothetical protein